MRTKMARDTGRVAHTRKQRGRIDAKAAHAHDVPKAPLRIRLPDEGERETQQFKADQFRKHTRKMNKAKSLFSGAKETVLDLIKQAVEEK